MRTFRPTIVVLLLLAAVAGLLASLQPPPEAGANPTSERKMYWTDWSTAKIQRADLSGSNVEELLTGLGGPIGIALDAAGGKMYWTDSSAHNIQRADLDGSNVEELVAGLQNPWAIALDVGGGKMYWTDAPAQKIQRADLSGSNVEELLTGLDGPLGIALDAAGGKMYWTELAGKIQRADLDGGNVEELVAGLQYPWGIALDVAGGKIYWADYGSDKIQRADLDGSNVEDLVTSGLMDTFGIALDIGGGKMYWTDATTQKIQRADMEDGGHVQELVTGLDQPWGIALNVGEVVPGCEANVDTDDDGFDNDVECYLGTDPLDNCPDDPTDDAWPPDVDNDADVDLLDILVSYYGNIGLLYSDPEWSPAIQRLDLNRDGGITMVGDVIQFYKPVFNESCNGGSPHPDPPEQGSPVTMGIDPEITDNTPIALGELEACVRVDVAPGDMGDGLLDHRIDVYVTDDPPAPTGYDAWVVYDPNRVDPVDWDDLVKLPTADSFTSKTTSRLNAGAGYMSDESGFPGDGTIARIDLDAISDGPACFALAVAYGKYASPPNVIHPTVGRAAMLAINEECPTEDLDGDDIFDICDNCLGQYNPDQTDIDGDGLGNACDNCPLDYNPLQENVDGDPWGDVCDNCLTTPTPWFVPVADDDCDGFTTGREDFVGTHSLDACADTPDTHDEPDDKWPPDFDDDQDTDIFDVLKMKPHFGSPGSNPYSARHDLHGQDGDVDIFDVLAMKPFFAKNCTP